MRLYWSLSLFIGAENNLLLYMVVICINMHTALNLPNATSTNENSLSRGLFIILLFFYKNLDYSKKEFSSLLCV